MNGPLLLKPRILPDTSMRAIAETVAAEYGITYAEITGPCRQKRVYEPRQDAMWRMWQVRLSDGRRRHTKTAIGRFFGQADHTSAVHGIDAHERRMAQQEQAA